MAPAGAGRRRPVLHRALFTGGFWPVLVLTVAGTLVVATVSWVVLEAPLLRRVAPAAAQPGELLARPRHP